MTETPIDVAPVSARFAALREAVGSVVVGQEPVLRQLYVTLLCSSHALVEGVPGVAKTLLVKTLAATLGQHGFYVGHDVELGLIEHLG